MTRRYRKKVATKQIWNSGRKKDGLRISVLGRNEVK